MTEYEKRLNFLLEECLKELETIDIRPYGKILSIRENSRTKSRLGCCRQIKGGLFPQYQLEISIMLKEWESQKLKEVIIHEVLHTCKGCLNHGALWKELAAEVNKAYGYSIKRTAEPQNPENVYRYRIRCSSCGNTSYRIKKSKIVQKPEIYRCARCGGALEVDQL